MGKRVEITDEMYNNARHRDTGMMNNFSFMSGAGNLVGFLGEEMIRVTYPEFKMVDGFDFDFEYGGYRIEIKTKSQTTSPEPLGYYEASIADQSMFQNTDIYIFCRVFKSSDVYKFGYIMGWISSSDFLGKARRLLRGDVDGDNGYIVKANCYNIRYDQLNEL